MAISTTTTEKSEPIELVVGTSAAFTFDNDTTVFQYTLAVEAGKLLNISLTNVNGTQLQWWISKDQESKDASGMVTGTCTNLVSGEEVGTWLGANQTFVPNTASTMIMALEDCEVCITVIANERADVNAWNGYTRNGWAACGGSLLASEVTIPTALETTVTSVAGVNFTSRMLSNIGLWVQPFNVAEDGWYLFSLNTSKGDKSVGSMEADGNVNVKIVEAGDPVTADWDDFNDLSICGEWNVLEDISRTTAWNMDGVRQYPTKIAAELEADEDYYLISENANGYIDSLSWSLLTPLEYVMGEDLEVNMADASAILTSAFTGLFAEQIVMPVLIDKDDFKMDTLYDVTLDLTTETWGWDIALAGDMTLDGRESGASESAQWLLFDNDSPQGSVEGITADVPVNSIGGAVSVSGKGGVFPNGTLGVPSGLPVWGANTLDLSNDLLVWVSATNGSAAVIPALGKPLLTFKIAENEDGVPDFPGEENTDGDLVATFDFNNLAIGGQGLYKLDKVKEKELNAKFAVNGMAGASVGAQPELDVQFYGPRQTDTITPGYNMEDIDNQTNSWAVDNLDPSRPLVNREMGILTDTLYVLVSHDRTATWADYLMNASAGYWTMTYELVDFYKNGDSVIVSKDNLLVIYKASVGPCATAKITWEYGFCCSSTTWNYRFVDEKISTSTYTLTATTAGTKEAACLSGAAYVYAVFWDSDDGDDGDGTDWTYPLAGFAATNNLALGIMFSLRVTTVSAAIPGYPLFLTLIASLGVVSILIYKRKRQ